MSNGNNEGDKRRLTSDDPVPPEQIKRFEEIAAARAAVADQMLRMEQDKIYLLASAKQLDDQHKRLFQALLTERGLPPDTAADLDAKTGKLTVKSPEKPAEQPPAQA